MKDKQIIIHDVNVTECEYHSLNKFGHILCDLENNPIVRSQGRLCEQNPICPYKVRYDLIQKLKHKEQECEWWKRQAELGSDTTDRLVKQLEEKEQEIDYCRENLHKQLDQLKAEYDCDERIIDQLEADLSDQEAETLKALGKIYNYKQALQEIKEFVENEMEQDVNTRIILQKISECEGNDVSL